VGSSPTWGKAVCVYVCGGLGGGITPSKELHDGAKDKELEEAARAHQWAVVVSSVSGGSDVCHGCCCNSGSSTSTEIGMTWVEEVVANFGHYLSI
jgi:hypothetical protein